MKSYPTRFVVCVAALVVSTVAYYLIKAEVADLHRGIELKREFEQAPTGRTSAWIYPLAEAGSGSTGAVRWLGRDTPISSEIIDAAKVNTTLSRQFADLERESVPRGKETPEPWTFDRVGVYVAYSKSYAKGVNGGALHFPGFCFQGAGWRILKEEKNVLIHIPGYFNGEIRVTVYLFEHPSRPRRKLVYYWMQNGDTIVSGRSRGKLGTFLKTLGGDRVGYLAQIRLDCWLEPIAQEGVVLTPEARAEREATLEDAAHKRLRDFGRAFLPYRLTGYLPNLETTDG